MNLNLYVETIYGCGNEIRIGKEICIRDDPQLDPNPTMTSSGRCLEGGAGSIEALEEHSGFGREAPCVSNC